MRLLVNFLFVIQYKLKAIKFETHSSLSSGPGWFTASTVPIQSNVSQIEWEFELEGIGPNGPSVLTSTDTTYSVKYMYRLLRDMLFFLCITNCNIENSVCLFQLVFALRIFKN